jgi:hypothetical protein
MVHGKDREIVLSQIKTIMDELGLAKMKCEVLFSKQCLKQKGASYH